MKNGLLGLKGWLALSGALVLAAGAAAGFLARSFFEAEGQAEESLAEGWWSRREIMQIPNQVIYDLLGLEPGQRTQAEKIMDRHYQKLKRLREEWDSLGREVNKDFEGILDGDQIERMKEVQRRIKIDEVAGRVSSRLSYFTRELVLNSQQEAALFPILLSDQVAKEEYFRTMRGGAGKDFDRKKFEADMKRMREDLFEKVKDVLTEEQSAKFKEIETRRPPWGGGGRGPGGSDGRHRGGSKGEQKPEPSAPPPAGKEAPGSQK